MISNKLPLIFVFLFVVLIISTAIVLFVFNYKHSFTDMRRATDTNTGSQNTPPHVAYVNNASNSITIENRTYRLSVKELKKLLEEARNVYLNALRNNETWMIMVYEPYSNFSKMLISNTTIVNDTTLLIGHTIYKYIVVHIYDAKSRLNFTPQRIQVNSILVELLPRNKSITYTGMVPYDYLVSCKDKIYRISFTSIGFVEASHYLTVSADQVSNNMYKVRIVVTRELGSIKYVNVAWLILIKN